MLTVEYLNLITLIFQGSVYPAYSRFENRVEFYNEFSITLCSILAICFTAWVPDPELQFLMGWNFCGFLLLQVFINLVLVITFSFLGFKLVIMKYYFRVSHKCCKKKEAIPVKQSVSRTQKEDNNTDDENDR